MANNVSFVFEMKNRSLAGKTICLVRGVYFWIEEFFSRYLDVFFFKGWDGCVLFLNFVYYYYFYLWLVMV